MVNKMNKLEHNENFVSLLHDLSNINGSFVLTPKDDKIELVRHDAVPIMAFKLVAPLSYFNISEPLAIYNFKEFYGFYKSQLESDIYLDMISNQIIFKTNDSELPYPLSDPEFIINDSIPSRFEVPEEDCDFVFNLSATRIKDLSTKISQIKPDVGTNSKLNCVVEYNDKMAEITIKAESYKASYKLKVNVDKIYNDEFEGKQYSISPNIFQYLPKNKDFLIFDIFEKVLIFKMIDPNISLNIVTWKLYE